MAAESWWAQSAPQGGPVVPSRPAWNPPGATPAPAVPPAWNGARAVPPPPAEAPREVLSEGLIHSRAEIQELAEQAREEIAFHSPLHHPDRKLTMWCSRPPEAARGILEACRWMLGERRAGPITGLDCDYPPTKDDLRTEWWKSKDVTEQLIPEWREIGDDYAAGYQKAIRWMQSNNAERPIAPR